MLQIIAAKCDKIATKCDKITAKCDKIAAKCDKNCSKIETMPLMRINPGLLESGNPLKSSIVLSTKLYSCNWLTAEMIKGKSFRQQNTSSGSREIQDLI